MQEISGLRQRSEAQIIPMFASMDAHNTAAIPVADELVRSVLGSGKHTVLDRLTSEFTLAICGTDNCWSYDAHHTGATKFLVSFRSRSSVCATYNPPRRNIIPNTLICFGGNFSFLIIGIGNIQTTASRRALTQAKDNQ